MSNYSSIEDTTCIVALPAERVPLEALSCELLLPAPLPSQALAPRSVSGAFPGGEGRGGAIAIDAGDRHRTTRLQGQALEVLGHAIEYLVDSRLVQFEEEATRADGDAVRLLIGASREVFAESPVYVPVTSRLRRWLYDRVMAAAA